MTVTLNLTIDIKGFDKVVSHFNNVNLWNVWRAFGREFVTMSRENFGASGGPRPAPWPALSKNYARRVNPAVPTLVRDKRRIINSIGFIATPNGCTVFSDTDIAAVHQWGGGNHIPARPFLPITGGPFGDIQLTEYARARLVTAMDYELLKAFGVLTITC